MRNEDKTFDGSLVLLTSRAHTIFGIHFAYPRA